MSLGSASMNCGRGRRQSCSCAPRVRGERAKRETHLVGHLGAARRPCRLEHRQHHPRDELPLHKLVIRRARADLEHAALDLDREGRDAQRAHEPAPARARAHELERAVKDVLAGDKGRGVESERGEREGREVREDEVLELGDREAQAVQEGVDERLRTTRDSCISVCSLREGEGEERERNAPRTWRCSSRRSS